MDLCWESYSDENICVLSSSVHRVGARNSKKSAFLRCILSEQRKKSAQSGKLFKFLLVLKSRKWKNSMEQDCIRGYSSPCRIYCRSGYRNTQLLSFCIACIGTSFEAPTLATSSRRFFDMRSFTHPGFEGWLSMLETQSVNHPGRTSFRVGRSINFGSKVRFFCHLQIVFLNAKLAPCTRELWAIHFTF